MKLRTQLLLAGLLVLALPMATWLYVKELYDVLRESGMREMAVRAEVVDALVARTAVTDLLKVDEDTPVFYAETSEQALVLDGFDEDWMHLDQPATVASDDRLGAGMSVRMAVSGKRLYVFVRVKDDQVELHNPNLGRVVTGDGVVFSLQDGMQQSQYVFRTLAPGRVSALRIIDRGEADWRVIPDNGIQAFWQMTPDGYAVEMRMSLPSPLSTLSVERLNVARSETAVLPSFQNVLSGRLIYLSETLGAAVASLVPAGLRLRLYNEAGWLVSDHNRLSEVPVDSRAIDPRTADLPTALLYRLFVLMTGSRDDTDQTIAPDSTERWTVESMPHSSPRSGRYRAQGRLVLALQQPLSTGGVMVLEAGDESISAVVSSTLVRLFAVLMAIVLTLLLVLMFYAGWISRRISAIGTATRDALQVDGRIETAIPDQTRRDELGDLSRNITTLLGRLRRYTDYLQSLSARLTHELRTPLAVVATSLESCEQGGERTGIYLQRASQATRRLQSIIRAMSESTRLEQMTRDAQFGLVDLRDWLAAVEPVYRDLYLHRDFCLDVGESPVYVEGCADLLQQMLDKLMANAVDFSDEGGCISLHLAQSSNTATLVLSNDGGLIADEIASSLFEPMVSQRDEPRTSSEPHLGLGLYIVKLIVSAHGGKVWAQNREDGRGVQVAVSLPRLSR